ncbi:MAG: aminoglycoside phosphotransferase family protein [Phormidesmis sp.]
MMKRMEFGGAIAQNHLLKIAAQFASQGEVKSVSPLGNGNINSTFLVTVRPAASHHLQNSLVAKRFVLQRINKQVFRQPERVIQNMVVLCEHLRASTDSLQAASTRRWETPQILSTRQGENYWVDEAGEYWRAISFVEDACVCETIQDLAHAEEVGCGLAMFHSLVNQLPVEKLSDPLPGFHITPAYLAHYEQILNRYSPSSNNTLTNDQAEQTQYCLNFIEQRKDWAHVLEKAKAVGDLQLRPIHGDPKVNNMMRGASGEVVSLIDLDTLKPGLVHYDIGDCLRSGCNSLGEETEDWQNVVFDVAIARAMLQGYLSLAKDFLTVQDYDYLYDAIRLLAFELGLRFFTDYLAGNVYFKVKHSKHNLMRSLVQFKLAESIEAQANQLQAMIQELRRR